MPQYPRFSPLSRVPSAVRRGGIAATFVVAAGLALLVAVGPSVRFRPHEFSPRVDALRPLNLLGNAVDDFAALT